jgi:hypothetical protein
MSTLARLGGTGIAAIIAIIISGGAAAGASPSAGLAGTAVKTMPPVFAAGDRGGSGPGAAAKQQCDVAYLRYGACYDYAGTSQVVASQGASVSFPVESANLAWNNVDGHSLMEMAVFNQTASGVIKDTAEVGWIVQGWQSGQAPVPQLFVYHFVNTKDTCYNGCGFVRTSKTIVPGMTLKPGTNATWSIRNIDGKWTFYFDKTKFGYIPDSAYHGTFGHGSTVDVYGEIAGSGTTPACNQMGNSLFGTQSRGAGIGGFQLYGASVPAGLQLFQPTDPAAWNSAATASTFRVGGPGDCLAMAGTVPRRGGGYTVVGRNTAAYAFAAGQSPWLRPSAAPARQVKGAGQIVGVAADPATGGYWMTDSHGDVYAVNAPSYGGLTGTRKHSPVAGITAFKSGYLLVTTSGQVYAFHAPSYGGAKSSSPIVGITGYQSGYLLAAADGTVYPVHTTGHGSVRSGALRSPITGIAADGHGYLLVSARGNVYAFDTPSRGSLAGTEVPEPILGITPIGDGYVLTGAFGEVYSFGTRLDGSVTNEGF